MSYYTDELNWLKAEIEKQKFRLNDMDKWQAQATSELEKLRREKASLKEQSAEVGRELNECLAAKQKTAEQLSRSPDEINVLVEKTKEMLSQKQQEKTDCEAQLEAKKQEMVPVFQKISFLKDSIDQCRLEIEQKNKIIDERKLVPLRLAEMKRRLENAMALKTGYVQKAEFSDELLKENVVPDSTLRGKNLEDYKKLCTELQNMKFEF